MTPLASVLYPTQLLRKLADDIAGYFFPPTCLSCNTLLALASPQARAFLCEDCAPGFVPTPVISPQGHLFAYPYQGQVQDAIYRLKYGRRAHVARGLGIAMANSLLTSPQACNLLVDIDLIIPVPIHPKRYRSRGFNQAELLARYFCIQLTSAGYSHIHAPQNALIRHKNTKPMAELTPGLRKTALVDAFSHNKKVNIVNKKILLVDDIYTTGATLDACAQVLLANGATDVHYATLAVVHQEPTNMPIDSD